MSTPAPPWSGVGDAQTLLDLFVPVLPARHGARDDLRGRPRGLARRPAGPHRAASPATCATACRPGRRRGDHGRQPRRVHDRPPRRLRRARDARVDQPDREGARHRATSCAIPAAVLAIVDEDNRELIDGLRDDCPALREVVVVGRGGAGRPRRLRRANAGRSTSRRRTAAARRHHAHLLHLRAPPGLAKGCMLDHRWWLRCVDIELRLNPKRRGRPDALVPAVLLRRPGGDARVHRPERRHAGGHAPLQRLALLGRRPRARRRRHVDDRLDAGAAAQGRAGPARARPPRATGGRRGRPGQHPPRAGRALRLPVPRQLRQHRGDDQHARAAARRRRDGRLRLDGRRDARVRDPASSTTTTSDVPVGELGEVLDPRRRALPRLPQPPGGDRRGDARRLVPHRRPRAPRRARLLLLPRAQEGHHPPQRRERRRRRDRGRHPLAPEGAGGGGDRRAGRAARRGDQGLRAAGRRRDAARRSRPRRSCATAPSDSRRTRCRATSSTATRTSSARRRCGCRRRRSRRDGDLVAGQLGPGGGSMPTAPDGAPRRCDLLVTQRARAHARRPQRTRLPAAAPSRSAAATSSPSAPSADVSAAYRAARTLDAHGAVVHPGFVESHYHTDAAPDARRRSPTRRTRSARRAATAARSASTAPGSTRSTTTTSTRARCWPASRWCATASRASWSPGPCSTPTPWPTRPPGRRHPRVAVRPVPVGPPRRARRWPTEIDRAPGHDRSARSSCSAASCAATPIPTRSCAATSASTAWARAPTSWRSRPSAAPTKRASALTLHQNFDTEDIDATTTAGSAATPSSISARSAYWARTRRSRT